MNMLLTLTFLGTIDSVLCYRCHVTDSPSDFHCGDAINMTCRGIEHMPHCTQITTDPNVQMNGVCSCEKFCFSDEECRGGCMSSFEAKCLEGYHLSIEKICLCVIRT